MMSLFIFLMQIPFITILFQGYLCEEDPTQDFTLPAMSCSGTIHTLLIAFSSLTLTIYILFLILQQQLFSSNNFESTLPWSSFERRLSSVRILYKLVLVACFVFGKQGQSKGQIGLICFVLCSIIVYKRIQDAIIFQQSVYYATMIYEVLIMWLFLNISMQTISSSQISITTLCLVIITGLFLGFATICYLQIKKSKCVEQEHPSMFKHPTQFEIYFFRIYEKIESQSVNDKIALSGMLYNHMHHCDDETCGCINIAESIDNISRYRKNKVKQEEEDRLAAIEQKRDAEVSMYGDRMTQFAINEPTIMKDLTTRRLTDKSMGGSPPIVANTALQRQPSKLGKLLQGKMTATSSFLQILQKSTKSQGDKLQRENSIASNMDNHGIFGDEPTSKRMSFAGSLLANRMKTVLRQSRLKVFNHSVNPDQTKSQKRQYKFLSLQVKQAIDKYPKNIDLKIINSFIQKGKLGNEFKAIFELMNCELCDPSLHDRFIIFRRKIEVEQNLIKVHQKNIQRIGQLDIVQVFEYEKHFLRYQMYEYLTVYAAQGFWKELLQKHIDAQVLKMRGQEISKNFELIQDVAKRLLIIYPFEIKFLYRYGTFLLRIINNEYDALVNFEKANNIFQNKIAKKSSAMPINEQTVFGENSASGMIIISCSSNQIGTIVHANDEIEPILGYLRKDLIGKNITTIIPRPIAKVHDKFVHRYFDTARPTVIDIKRNIFAKNKDGYIREIELLVKVHPHLTDRILFIGFLQKTIKFNEMEPPKTEYDNLEQQYILTDDEGNIANVTEGLNFDLGLNSKIFNYSDSIFQQMFNLKTICPDLFDPDFEEALESDGTELQIDTRNILSQIELEQLTSEEILEVRSNIGIQNAVIQLKKFVLDKSFCTIFIYRILILPKTSGTTVMGQNILGSTCIDGMRNNNSGSMGQSEGELASQGSAQSPAMGAGQMSVAGSSISSNSSNNFAFNGIIKDFKKALGERKTPGNLVMLDRIMILIILTTIALTSAAYAIEHSSLNLREAVSIFLLMSESRSIQIVQLASNIRSFVDIANQIEFDTYEAGSLEMIDRFQYLNSLIQNQAAQLSLTHQYLTQQRQGATAGEANLISDDYEMVDLYRLDQNNIVNVYQQPFRVAFSTYLNNILMVNVTNSSNLLLQFPLIQSSPNGSAEVYNSTSQVQKMTYFLLTNGLRSMRTYSYQSTLYQLGQENSSINESAFLVIMVLGILISVLSMIIILYQVLNIEKNKTEILSLYAYLSIEDVNKVYKRCHDYMDNLNQCRLVGAQQQEVEDQTGDPNKSQKFPEITQQQPRSQLLSIPSIKDISFQIGIGNIVSTIAEKAHDMQQSKNIHNYEYESEQSEEEKDEDNYKKYILQQRKKRQMLRAETKQGSKHKNGPGNDVYSAMIKHTIQEFKEITDKEDQIRLKFYQQRQCEAKKQRNIQMGNHNDSSYPETKKEVDPPKKQKKFLKNDDEDSKKESSPQIQINEGKQEEEEADRRREQNSKQKKHKSLSEVEQDDNEVSLVEISSAEQEQRKKLFFQTIRRKNWGSSAVNSLAGILFAAYFIQMYILNDQFVSQMLSLQSALPIFFDQYKDLMLSYAFMRERIINNDSLSTYESDAVYGTNLDQLYNDESLAQVKNIDAMKNVHPSIMQPIIDLIMTVDSQYLCSSVIESANYNVTLSRTMTDLASQDSSFVNQFQYSFLPIILAEQAAMTGSVSTINQIIYQENIQNLNQGNYDGVTLLHIAVIYGQLPSVQQLLQYQINVNTLDIWGKTPLNYAQMNSTIYNILVSNGAYAIGPQSTIKPLNVVLQNTDYEFFYAAYLNDVTALTALVQAGQNVNVQDSFGRTPLHIAAAQGNLYAVQFLISQGAIIMDDVRAYDQIEEATRLNKTQVANYMRTYLQQSVIQKGCESFAQGFLQNGFESVMGQFQKKFTDLSIIIGSNSTTYEERMSYLVDALGTGESNITVLQTFFSLHELYLHQIIDQYINVISSTFVNTATQYNWIIQLIYLLFLLLQLFILFILRAKLIQIMRDDIFSSRGILNLIPDDFFEQHKTLVENLIKKLKN